MRPAPAAVLGCAGGAQLMRPSSRSEPPQCRPPGSSGGLETAGPEHRVLAWPDRPTVAAPDAAGPSRYCYLLDVDADLADAFDPRSRMVVRQVAPAPLVEVPVGRECAGGSTAGPAGLGMLLVDGLVALEVRVGDRTATELLGPGDLLQPQRSSTVDHLLERQVTRRALVRCRPGFLDADFADRRRPWPQIVLTLLRRSEQRAVELDVQRAITSHPSLEVRLAL